jgi:sporulation protein YlmC with PRC-barrel domain
MARDPVTRGLRDEADVGPDPRTARELKRLSELRYKVADGDPDIRGWKVYASTGRELGTVSDLLVDVDAGEVVMLDVDLRRNDRHTLAPIRAAWIDHATQRVVLDAREAERAVAGGAADAATTTTGASATGASATAGRPADDADDAGLPALPRGGALTDDDVRRFNDDYSRAYGERGVDSERAYRLRRGEEELRFGSAPRRLLDPSPGATGATGGGLAAGAGAGVACGLTPPSISERWPPTPSPKSSATMKKVAAAPRGIVARRVCVPRGPNAVLDTELVKSEPGSDLPGCKSTEMMTTTHERRKSP